MRDIDKFRGCLVGGAAGDALGYEVEFMNENSIFNTFGKHGITEYTLHGGLARISDDTQMTLFTATGLLVGTTRGMNRGIMGPYQSYIAYSYSDWLKTQTHNYPLGNEYHYSWLVNVPELFSRRAPGNTCLSSLSSGKNGSIAEPINRSKGCGGVMRVAPIGIYFSDKPVDIKQVDLIGAETAAITHGHDLGYIPAAALVHIVHRLASNPNATIKDAVLDSVEMMKSLFPDAPHLCDFTELMTLAVELSGSDRSDLEAIHILGEGWVAEETLAIAVFCALRHQDDFDKALIAAVNHNGDSDSTGAVTGNILGTFIGYEAIPEKYKHKLEFHDLILDIADDLCNDCKMTEYGDYYDEVWVSKYIKMNYKGSYHE